MINEGNNDIQMKCFSIISYVGDAKSNYVEALQCARVHDFERAEKLLEEGRKSYIEGHKVHAELVAKEAEGKSIEISILLIHAETLMVDAESMRINVKEFINIYKCSAERGTV